VQQRRISFGRKAARALVGGAVASAALLSVATAMDSRTVRPQHHAYGDHVENQNEGCAEGWEPAFAEGPYETADVNGDGVVCTQTTPDGGTVVTDNQA
jgi:hypothetical protein